MADATLAIAADGHFAKAFLRRAQAYELLEKWQEAVRDLSKVLELDKELPGVAAKLKAAKVELKKSQRVDYYKVCLPLWPSSQNLTVARSSLPTPVRTP